MDRVYLSYNKTFVIRQSDRKRVESVRIPTVPELYELSYTDDVDFQDSESTPISDNLVITGDIFKTILKNYPDRLFFEDEFVYDLRKALYYDFRERLTLNDEITSRIPITISRGFNSIFMLSDTVGHDFVESINGSYTDQFEITDNFSYEI